MTKVERLISLEEQLAHEIIMGRLHTPFGQSLYRQLLELETEIEEDKKVG